MTDPNIYKNPLLKKILWADFMLGAGTAALGLLLYPVLESFLGLSAKFIVFVSVITLVYALAALRLALQVIPSARLLKLLILANWIWAFISVGLLLLYFSEATIFGKLFLLLQVLVVGGLAYWEGYAVRSRR